MLAGRSEAPAFGWRAAYELQIFRDGRWVISAVFDDLEAAMDEARHLDRNGRMVKVKEESVSLSGDGQRVRTLFLSQKIKNTWAAESKRMTTSRSFRAPPQPPVQKPSRGPNYYYLVGMFSLVTFAGLAAIFALRTLYAAV